MVILPSTKTPASPKTPSRPLHKFKCRINAFDWKYIYSDMDLELLYDKLINYLVELFNLNYPIVIVIVIVIFIWWSPFIPSRNLDEVFTYNHIWL